MIQVEIVRPDTTSELLTFDKSEVLIGRKASNDIVLGGLDVSGNHACLQVADGGLVVVDLGSTNGTFVRGERVQMTPIVEREEIRVAGYVLRVQAAGAAGRGGEPAAPPLIEGILEPPPLLAADFGAGDLPPLVAGATGLGGLGELADAPPLLQTTEPPAGRAAASIAPGDPPGIRPANATTPTSATATTPTPTPTPTATLAPAGPDLAAIWADPTITRMILRDGDPIELQRQGGARERLAAPPVHDLGDALARITGRKDMSEGPSSTSLPGGAALWWARGADGRLCAALERPQAQAPALAEAIQAGVLDDALALRLLGALGSGRPLLFAARPGAAEALALPLALALAAAGRRPGALIRGHVDAIALPTAAPITLLDAADPQARAAALALALRLGAGWIVVDEAPPPTATRAAQRAGVAVLIVLAGVSPALALRRADARLVDGDGSVDFAHLVVVGEGPRGPAIERVVDPGPTGFHRE